MRVRFWGVRGSIPTPGTGADVVARMVDMITRLGHDTAAPDLRDRQAVQQWVEALPAALNSPVGGNTPCVEMRTESGELFIIDFGSGLRMLGNEMMNGPFGQGQGRAHLFLSHFHWDHIQGWPFFRPVYVEGNEFDLYSRHEDVELNLQKQMSAPFFPPDAWAEMRANVRYHPLPEGTLSLCDGAVKVTSLELDHPSRAFAYRFEADGAVFVYASDGSFPLPEMLEATQYIDFFAGADLVIFDAQFSLAESLQKRDWGHSSGITGVDLACRAGAKRIALFHHDPNANDAHLDELLSASEKFAIAPNMSCTPGRVDVFLAREGLELEL
jgi:phosphoribosyl 1,2-cyclic phosphodiesterase